jgi:WD40 repeat protein
VAFSPDGRIAVTCDTHPTLRLWDVETKKEIRHFKGASGLGPHGVVFSPDGRRLLSCWSNRVLLLDAETGKEVGCFTEHGEDVQSVAVSPDGRLALSGGDDRTVRLWKLSK